MFRYLSLWIYMSMDVSFLKVIKDKIVDLIEILKYPFQTSYSCFIYWEKCVFLKSILQPECFVIQVSFENFFVTSAAAALVHLKVGSWQI